MAEEVAKNGVLNEGFSETDIDKVSDTTSASPSVIEGCQIVKWPIEKLNDPEWEEVLPKCLDISKDEITLIKVYDRFGFVLYSWSH